MLNEHKDFVTIRLVFSKTGRARYISHLDLNRAMIRAIRRAALPIVSDATRLRGDTCFEAEQRFTDLWALGEPESEARRAGQELTRPFVRVEA